ncbi:type II toxin-antitoxin system HipA family toxin [bacterium]|nr:type II toxin-antitoxin system HipA family toxin [bacterium]
MIPVRVNLWNSRIGAIDWDEERGLGVFEYEPDFAASVFQVSPIVMPLRERPITFASNRNDTFHGLPGLIADSLPDRFGNALIDAYLARVGRSDINPVERLCYIGKRGIGALEFQPEQVPQRHQSKPLEVAALVQLASDILSEREGLQASFDDPDREEALLTILRVGSSAGGARAKALIAYNETTGEVRSGQLPNLPQEFSHWLLKFDGVEENRDKDLNDPMGYGRIEYAYSNMVHACKIEMTECRLLEENDRSHFMTRRFDRTREGKKLHMQSLCALAHFDFNRPGEYSYEQAFQVLRLLNLPMDAIVQLFRRMAFNVVARNQDDHTKNIAFLMDRHGEWSLAPAFDMTYSYRPDSIWTGAHQMTLNGKRDSFVLHDFDACGEIAMLKRGQAREIVEEVVSIVKDWREYASKAGVPDHTAEQIAKVQRLDLF